MSTYYYKNEIDRGSSQRFVRCFFPDDRSALRPDVKPAVVQSNCVIFPVVVHATFTRDVRAINKLLGPTRNKVRRAQSNDVVTTGRDGDQSPRAPTQDYRRRRNEPVTTGPIVQPRVFRHASANRSGRYDRP